MNIYNFASTYGSGTYNSGTYENGTTTTTGGTTTGTGVTGGNTVTGGTTSGVLTNTGFDIALAVTVAAVLCLVAVVVRFWKRPATKAESQE